MYGKMKEHLSKSIAEIKEAGLYKEERLIESAQQAAITVKGKEVLNFCANNYLGLSNHPRLIEGAKRMMDRRGFGMSSVRLNRPYLTTSKPKILFFMPPVSMLMGAYSNLFSPKKTPSSVMPLTMRPSSTVLGSAKQNAIATKTLIWPTSNAVCKRHNNSASASLLPMACSLWTVMWRPWIESAIWLKSTMRW